MLKPIILGYFSQEGRGFLTDDARMSYLNTLKEERSNFLKIWKKRETEIEFKVNHTEAPDLQELQEDCDASRSGMVMFQFSGHADPEILYLGGVELDAGNLVDCLSEEDPIDGTLRLKTLKLVVLNGCRTEKSIQYFLKAGALAVIATHYPVYDQAAMIFSNVFNRKLSEGMKIIDAFKEARKALMPAAQLPEGEKGESKQPIAPETYRSGMLKPGGKYCDRWGIFLSEEKNAEANQFIRDPDWWKILEEETKSEPNPIVGTPKKETRIKLYPDVVYTYDRVLNSRNFDELRDIQENEKKARAQHYMVVAEQGQSPIGFTKKLVYQYITENRTLPKKYFYHGDPIEAMTRKNIIQLDEYSTVFERFAKRVFGAIYTPDPYLKTAEEIIADFVLKHSEYDYMIIIFSIDLQYLTPQMTHVIHEFKSFFGRIDKGYRTKYYFFWNIIFNQLLLPAKLSADPYAHALSLIKEPLLTETDTPPFLLLNFFENDAIVPLPQPNKYEVDQWYDQTIGNALGEKLTPAQRNELWLQKDILDLKEVENKLIDIVDQANGQP